MRVTTRSQGRVRSWLAGFDRRAPTTTSSAHHIGVKLSFCHYTCHKWPGQLETQGTRAPSKLPWPMTSIDDLLKPKSTGFERLPKSIGYYCICNGWIHFDDRCIITRVKRFETLHGDAIYANGCSLRHTAAWNRLQIHASSKFRGCRLKRPQSNCLPSFSWLQRSFPPRRNIYWVGWMSQSLPSHFTWSQRDVATQQILKFVQTICF